MIQEKSVFKQLVQIPIIVAALGYFVDVYDLLLFSIVRIPSLQSIGISGAKLLTDGAFLTQVAAKKVGIVANIEFHDF